MVPRQKSSFNVTFVAITWRMRDIWHPSPFASTVLSSSQAWLTGCISAPSPKPLKDRTLSHSSPDPSGVGNMKRYSEALHICRKPSWWQTLDSSLSTLNLSGNCQPFPTPSSGPREGSHGQHQAANEWGGLVENSEPTALFSCKQDFGSHPFCLMVRLSLLLT